MDLLDSLSQFLLIAAVFFLALTGWLVIARAGKDRHTMSLRKAYSEIQRWVGEEIPFPLESEDVILSVEKHRRFWKPCRVRVLLLAESHVFTSSEDNQQIIEYPPELELTGFPEEYVRLVYCLGYGENNLVNVENNPGTPKFWKLFVSCINEPSPEAFNQVLIGGTPNLITRIRNKVKVLNVLKEKGVWLLDASIVGLYNTPEEMDPCIVNSIFQISWKHHISKVIRKEKPQKIIIIGKGVYRQLRQSVAETGIPYCSVEAPTAFGLDEAEYYQTIHEKCQEVL